MASNLASKDAPMTLGRRQMLEQIRIPFQVAHHEMIFSTVILEVLDKQHLCAFVNNLLSKLNHEYQTHDTPSPGLWKLMRNSTEEDLNRWDPHKMKPDTPILIVSSVDKHLGTITITPTTRNDNSWAWTHEMRSCSLPTGKVFELQGDSHLLLVLRCQTKTKISKKQRRIDETIHTILVPANYRVAEVLILIRANDISGVYEEPHPNDLRQDHRSATELGWKHGTTLRLELW